MDMRKLESTDQAIREKMYPDGADIALILGSGWGAVVDAFDIQAEQPYDEMPAMGNTAIVGHDSRLVLARAANRRLLIFQGRHHWYEGGDWTPIACPVFLAIRAGAKALLITNAAGAIRKDLKPGDRMLVTDHINMMDDNPLRGSHHPFWGTRFPGQSQVYDPLLNAQLRKSAVKTDQSLQEGVYLATSGPCYETPAEIRAFRTLGADAVGMSTIPEAMLAAAAGMRTAAISCITNSAADVETPPPAHAAVLETAEAMMPSMQTLLHHAVSHASL